MSLNTKTIIFLTGQNTLNLRCWFHISSFIGQAKVIFKFKNIWHDYTSYCLINLKLCNILTWVKGELWLGHGNQQTLPFFLCILRIYKKNIEQKDSYWSLLLRKTTNSMLINEWWTSVLLPLVPGHHYTQRTRELKAINAPYLLALAAILTRCQLQDHR